MELSYVLNEQCVRNLSTRLHKSLNSPHWGDILLERQNAAVHHDAEQIYRYLSYRFTSKIEKKMYLNLLTSQSSGIGDICT